MDSIDGWISEEKANVQRVYCQVCGEFTGFIDRNPAPEITRVKILIGNKEEVDIATSDIDIESICPHCPICGTKLVLPSE